MVVTTVYINRMIKRFSLNQSSKFIISSLFIVVALMIFNILHLSLSNTHKYLESLDTFTKITTLPGISRSVSYHETRFIEYKDYSTTLDPFKQNGSIGYMDFIYE